MVVLNFFFYLEISEKKRGRLINHFHFKFSVSIMQNCIVINIFTEKRFPQVIKRTTQSIKLTKKSRQKGN